MLGARLHAHNSKMAIHVLIEKVFQFRIQRLLLVAVSDDRFRVALNVQRISRRQRVDPALAFEQDIVDQLADQFADDVVARNIVQVSARPFQSLDHASPDFETLQLRNVNQARLQTVVQIVRVVGEFIGDIGDLRFQARTRFLRNFAKGAAVIGGFVFGDAFEGLEASD